MSVQIADVLWRLEVLVRCDTRNPPRKIAAGDAVFEFLRSQLEGFRIELEDYGSGHLALLAVRGKPDTVFNFHLDTVPDADGWTGDPFTLQVLEDKAVGLGACDIKGALACMLAAADCTRGDLAVLVTTDEEAGVGRAVREFLASDHGFRNAVVAEPTRGAAVTAHRGIVTALVSFKGIAGHASAARASSDSAVHRALRWGARCLDVAESWRDLEALGLRGVPLNIGRIEGGIKPNMIAEHCALRLGLRTLPGQDGKAMMNTLVELAAPGELADFDITFHAPSLPARGEQESAAALAQALGVETGAAVDFWSEAALFSHAGMTAVVLGSGDIAQAHTANEWVALSELSHLATLYEEMLTRGH